MTDKDLVLYIFHKYKNPKTTGPIVSLIEKYTTFRLENNTHFGDILRIAIYKFIFIYNKDVTDRRPKKDDIIHHQVITRNHLTLQKIMKNVNEYRVKNWYWKKFDKSEG